MEEVGAPQSFKLCHETDCVLVLLPVDWEVWRNLQAGESRGEEEEEEE